MKPELEAFLRQCYPLLYAEPYLRFGGMTCGTGWFTIIEELSAKLETLIFAERHPEHYRAEQVKEKFGGLRFYMSTATEEMTEAIVEAEAASFRTCEHCGAPGALRSGGWIRTLCDACHDVTEREKVKPKP